ncbi:Hypothetical predicted protein [Lecanosticta acicola]|uniref:Cryptic loci regulator 2 N-terminal domain-containing protein n=1 Tax=Lecanosticta acicola TaxID=111012 RepID=A0AAI8Z8Y3_9PEZI|nr:Hypothetical predicted protein [Lecanosticta acicola]
MQATAPRMWVHEINPYSDGTGADCYKPNTTPCDQYICEKISDKLLSDRELNIQFESGHPKTIPSLQAGYSAYERQRRNNGGVDRWIYGHPNGSFDSVSQYYQHFKYCLLHGTANGCGCYRCSPGSRTNSYAWPQSFNTSFNLPIASISAGQVQSLRVAPAAPSTTAANNGTSLASDRPQQALLGPQEWPVNLTSNATEEDVGGDAQAAAGPLPPNSGIQYHPGPDPMIRSNGSIDWTNRPILLDPSIQQRPTQYVDPAWEAAMLDQLHQYVNPEQYQGERNAIHMAAPRGNTGPLAQIFCENGELIPWCDACYSRHYPEMACVWGYRRMGE